MFIGNVKRDIEVHQDQVLAILRLSTISATGSEISVKKILYQSARRTNFSSFIYKIYLLLF